MFYFWYILYLYLSFLFANLDSFFKILISSKLQPPFRWIHLIVEFLFKRFIEKVQAAVTWTGYDVINNMLHGQADTVYLNRIWRHKLNTRHAKSLSGVCHVFKLV
jgi:hypothetical protein